MKVLQLAPRIPYPLTEGGNIGIFYITRELSRHGAEIHFAGISGSKVADTPPELSNLCEDLLIIPSPHRYGISSAFRNFFSDVPINIEKYHSRDVLKKIIKFVEGKKIDLIHVDHLHMAYYGLALRDILKVPVVLREHNLELKIMDRFSQSSSNPLYRGYAAIQLRKFLKYEPGVCAEVDKCIMITDQDRERLLSLRRDTDSTVIPAGVDVDYFKPNGSDGEEDTIAYIGSLDWLPNIDGLKWFVKEILPTILRSRPTVTFFIYGKNPSRDVGKLHDGTHVIVKGFVEDVREVFRRARVVVVPLLAGSGMRIKILEAMAAGKAIVTTSIGKEGIHCGDGGQIMVGDTPDKLAEKVLMLLENKELCLKLGVAAARLVQKEYSWTSVGERFWDTYLEIIEKSKMKGK